MSEKDVVSIDYIEDPVKFANLMNGYYFSGNTVILPEHIHERKNHNAIRRTKKSMVVSQIFWMFVVLTFMISLKPI